MPRFFAMPWMMTAMLVATPTLAGPLRQAAESTSTEAFVDDEPPIAGRVTFNLGGGLLVPIGKTGDRFDAGWGFLLGAGYHFTDRFGAFLEYQYSDFDLKDRILQDENVAGDHIMQYGNLNFLFGLLPKGRVGLYLTGGPGLYYRKVEITELAGATLVPVCDPWLLICYTDVVPVSNVIGSRSSTDFGLNGGVGISYRIYANMRVYLEARYHYIFGPKFNAIEGTQRADGQYLPINLGLRF
ncbi:hypothetical protein MYSTI_04273 [Myxococcus stipitatus DSM 14675]|uniref:Outer membrane protein beta-barrel domain-containing protein n=1 Tax=Myxococcus stipitatus (strain DSM 14675 / JCM 12634 / Mx s8) TaxID=1278073 RepID=L7U9G3_MYXSD|nr:porin family protein [Myxococcus stipitatus]AGC45571.1 hypothetical protein MYSTI_04273 [Myxococcus stipitatus DSM 14675]